ncbi:DUF605-domain-containing protein [Aspergillus steynii IBT 23096]|uniref:DUF605-domain-containing protein n=1 Tax=Aspergillus steynii IBT 23096 TaxID=1392250 RepID=A0A2I2FWV5_9EURO|nr:DUF605-domain-containing protein [Aspergillus steynii IBT 23096]PLB45119.1 DUF605-domain-containing protein [Aspergillus steynii IBT 23096]
MASNIPAGLKSADIGRFAVRAAQLERVKPVIAYWCNFWIVNQIIEKGLHSDDEVKLYTTNLVDKLETFKEENPDNDTVTDAVAANAYVEEFGLEIFARAEATMRANKVTKQTADTFQAAATFLELCQIWHTPEPELAVKIKFAKYHALRIAKAIKAGEDPNETNPVIEEDNLEPKEDDPEVQAIVQSLPPADPEALPGRQPSVEDVPDEPSAQPSGSTPTLPQVPTSFADIQPPHQNAPSPAMDLDHDQGAPLNLPSAPDTFASSASAPNLPDTPTQIGRHHSSGDPNAFQSFPPPSSSPDRSPAGTPFDAKAFYNQSGPPSLPAQTSPGPLPVVSRPTPHSVPSTAHIPVAPTPSQANTPAVDDNAIAQAQKHARWAVSALTFDDVNTAIKELKNSLKQLGAE